MSLWRTAIEMFTKKNQIQFSQLQDRVEKTNMRKQHNQDPYAWNLYLIT